MFSITITKRTVSPASSPVTLESRALLLTAPVEPLPPATLIPLLLTVPLKGTLPIGAGKVAPPVLRVGL